MDWHFVVAAGVGIGGSFREEKKLELETLRLEMEGVWRLLLNLLDA